MYGLNVHPGWLRPLYGVGTIAGGYVVLYKSAEVCRRCRIVHEHFHNHLGIFRKEKPGTNNIAGGIVDDGVEIGLAPVSLGSNFRPVQEVSAARLSEVTVGKESCRFLGANRDSPAGCDRYRTGKDSRARACFYPNVSRLPTDQECKIESS